MCDVFAKAIAKHGAENFTHEILQECATQEEANEAETKWIATLGSMVPAGYNLHAGGRGRGFATDDARRKMRDAARDRRAAGRLRKAQSEMTPEQRSEVGRRANEALTPEQRSARALKAAETRARRHAEALDYWRNVVQPS